MSAPISRRHRRPTVQLTSLLDLLFVMIFVSLLQTKSAPRPATEAKAETPETKVVETKSEAPKKPVPKTIPLTANFQFYATSRNPRVPPGEFSMRGVFNRETGDLTLAGDAWIKRPSADYGMVPLKGRLDPEARTLTGRIDYPDCREFVLRMTDGGAGDEITGVWKGVYHCGQGETGLTLNIQ